MKMEAELLMKALEFKGINENEMRKFECWGSVEVVDRHNEIIPAEEVYKIMDIWMARGAPIQYMHTNKNIGKGLNWQKDIKDGNPGVLITGIIYKNYKEDDKIWEGIKKGQFEGLSIGGGAHEKIKNDDGTVSLKGLIGYEFSLVERCGNQEATFTKVNTMAKSEKEIKKEDTVMDENPEAGEDDQISKIMNMITALAEKVSMIEEKISGGPEEEAPVEEQKAEEKPEEETKEEKPEEDSEEEEKVEKTGEAEEVEKSTELTDIKKRLDVAEKELVDIKKASIVVKKIEAKRPAEKVIKKESKYQEINKSLDSMSKNNKIDFNVIEKQIRGI